jgi:hypothetical protein
MSDVTLDGAGSAELAGDGHTLRYRIPIRSFDLAELPGGAHSTRSKGRLEGEVKLDPHGTHRARAHTAALVLDIDGTLTAEKGAPSARWRLNRSQSVEQHTEILKDQLASGS